GAAGFHVVVGKREMGRGGWLVRRWSFAGSYGDNGGSPEFMEGDEEEKEEGRGVRGSCGWLEKNGERAAVRWPAGFWVGWWLHGEGKTVTGKSGDVADGDFSGGE
ncbi:hypothetical protein HAX54_016320, partial [Datura stramonium]|nr:hypothetical protein [Datura stramonium]